MAYMRLPSMQRVVFASRETVTKRINYAMTSKCRHPLFMGYCLAMPQAESTAKRIGNSVQTVLKVGN